MDSIVACPACRQRMRLENEWLGQAINCPKCDHEFIAQAAKPSAPPAPPRPPAPPSSRGAASTVLGESSGPPSRRPTAPAPPSAPPRKRSSAGPSFAPIAVSVALDSNRSHGYQGNFRGQITPEGLTLTNKTGSIIIPVGSRTEYSGDNALESLVANSKYTYQVTRQGSDANKLAQYLAEFLNGERARLSADDFAPPKTMLMMAMVLGIVGGIGLLVGIVLIVMSLLGGGGWRAYSSQPGRFTAQFPGIPVESTKPVPDAPPSVQMYAFTVDRGNRQYVVEYVDLPSELNKQALANGPGKEAAQGISGGTVQKNSKVSDTGWEFEIDAGSNGKYLRRMIANKARVYRLTVGGTGLTAYTDSNARRFMDGFKMD